MIKRSLVPACALALALLFVGCTNSKTPTPKLELSDFMKATVVIGQSTFTGDASHLTQSGLNDVYGNPALVGGTLYLPDYGNARVLGFTGGIPSTNGANADFVLGQPDFTSDNQVASAQGLGGPETVRAAGSKLLVDDWDNNRVLIWNSHPTTTQASANVVVGQTDLTSSASACSQTGLDGPESIFTYGGKLLVADANNNRVLIYNSIPSSSGAAADLVIGQNSFTTCAENDDNQDGTADTTPSDRTLYYPTDVWTNGTKLIVADDDNNRVLIWNSFPTTNFAHADVVIGQDVMTTNDYDHTATTMDGPYNLASDGTRLLVSDSYNHRVLVYSQIPSSSGKAADNVLGQSNFTNDTENDDNQDGTADSTPSARTFYYPTGMLLTDQALIVMDEYNNRALVFTP